MKVDFTFFKPSGKYYMEEKIEVDVSGYDPQDYFSIRNDYVEKMKAHRSIEEGMIAVSLDSDKLGFPMMVKGGRLESNT